MTLTGDDVDTTTTEYAEYERNMRKRAGEYAESRKQTRIIDAPWVVVLYSDDHGFDVTASGVY